MKKMTVVSVLTLILCFLIGYVAYQTAYLVKTLVVGPQTECRAETDAGCPEQTPAAARRGRR